MSVLPLAIRKAMARLEAEVARLEEGLATATHGFVAQAIRASVEHERAEKAEADAAALRDALRELVTTNKAGWESPAAYARAEALLAAATKEEVPR